MTEATANVCYRHPNRPAYVSCQRCDRRICPECQTTAAVGVICPECVRAQQGTAPRNVRQVRNSGRPVVTYTIMLVTIAVWLLQLVPGLGVTDALFYVGVYSMPTFFEPWRMLTSVLVHSPSNVLHIALNMYTLWIFGRLLEPFIGHWRFAALYVLAGLGGSVGVLWLSPETPVIGASGAIFGVIGAFIVIHRSLGGSATQLYVLVALNLVIGFLPGMNVAWQAHVGGLAVGALIGWLFASTRRIDQLRLQQAGLALIAVALVLLSLRYVVLPA